MGQKRSMKRFGDNITKRATEFGGIGLMIGGAIGKGADTVSDIAPSGASQIIKVVGKAGGLAAGAVGAIVGAVTGVIYGAAETIVDKD